MNNNFADQLRSRRGVALVSLTVGVVAVVLYLPTLRYGFVGEDNALIVHSMNRLNAQTDEIFQSCFRADTPAGTEFDGGVNVGRPLTAFSFFLDRRVAGTKPWYFHLVNVVLYTGVAVFVVLIVWELHHSGVWAGIAGLLFVSHPSHVEPVSLVSARAELLTALFLSFAVFALLRSFRKRNWRWWLVIPLGYTLGLLSKESAFLFPLIVLLTPFLTQSRFPRKLWLVFIGLVLIGIAYLVLYSRIFNQPVIPKIAPLRVFNVANTFGFYVRMFFWPFNHQIKIPLDPAFQKLTPFFLYALLFLIVPPLAALRRRFRIGLWGYFWATIFLLQGSGVCATRFQAAERFLFLPSVGIVVLVVTMFSRLLVAQHGLRRFVGFGLVGIAGLLVNNSLSRLPVWQDEKSFYSAMVKEVPGDPGAYFGLGRVLQSAMPDSAITLYKRAILLDQGFAPAHIKIAILYREKGDYRRAIHHLRLADQLSPGCTEIQTNLGFAFLYSGQPDSALAAFRRVIVIDSAHMAARLGAELTQIVAGTVEPMDRAWARLKASYPAWEDSIRHILRRLAQSRGYELAVDRLGKALVGVGDTTEAEVYYRRALERDSNCVAALYNLAVLLARRGETTPALLLARRAAKLRPEEETIQKIYRSLQIENREIGQ
ncbi:MAG: tetratricopeptide repeat protein [bacterium]